MHRCSMWMSEYFPVHKRPTQSLGSFKVRNSVTQHKTCRHQKRLISNFNITNPMMPSAGKQNHRHDSF